MAKQPTKGRKRPAETDETPIEGTTAAESVTAPETRVDVIPPEVHAKSALSVDPTQEPAQATVAEQAPAAQETPAAEQRQERPAQPQAGAGFLPLALGGLLAGVIGFGVATFTAPATDDGLTVQLAQQSAAIAALEQRLAQADTAASSDELDGLTDQITALSAAVSEVSARLAELENRPVVLTPDGSEASEAVVADMDALRAQLAEMADAAQTELEEARAAAAAIEENAARAARNAAARAALARVQTAMESGSPIGAALADLEDALGEAAPAELLAVEDGVATLPALQDSFPDFARAALATARSEGVAGEATSGLGAFLRNQFDVRSTAPRDGDDADAVLSRAEAALRAGRLSDALAEIGGLPEVARAEMSDWLSMAEARAGAVAAVDVLTSTLSDN